MKTYSKEERKMIQAVSSSKLKIGD